MKNQIFAVVFGLILSFANVSFAQTGASYKQQFKSSVNEKVCTNVSTSLSLNGNYKMSGGQKVSPSNSIASSVSCCNDSECAKLQCCVNGNCSKGCCSNNQMSANYKHTSFQKVKGGCEMTAKCDEHKAACCN